MWNVTLAEERLGLKIADVEVSGIPRMIAAAAFITLRWRVAGGAGGHRAERGHPHACLTAQPRVPIFDPFLPSLHLGSPPSSTPR